MNRKLKIFLALLVYSFSEGGKAWPEALKTNLGHLSRGPSFLLCKRLVNPIAYLVSVLSAFQDLKGGKHLRFSCDMTNFKVGDEFTSFGFLMAVAYSDSMFVA